MNKLRWWGGVVAVAVVAIGVIVVPAGSQQPPERVTLTFFEPNKSGWERFVDVGRPSGSPGDQVLFIGAELDPETCERVGRLVGHITLSKPLPEDGWFVGQFTLYLPDGKIIASGSAKFSEFAQQEKAVFAVTGGTEAYRDASGQVSFQEDVTLCDRKGSLTTVDIGPRP